MSRHKDFNGYIRGTPYPLCVCKVRDLPFENVGEVFSAFSKFAFVDGEDNAFVDGVDALDLH